MPIAPQMAPRGPKALQKTSFSVILVLRVLLLMDFLHRGDEVFEDSRSRVSLRKISRSVAYTYGCRSAEAKPRISVHKSQQCMGIDEYKQQMYQAHKKRESECFSVPIDFYRTQIDGYWETFVFRCY